MRVAVIGGGMAGLSAAHELLRRGADPVVFEAAARAGGKVGSRSEQGWLTEDGPGFIARPLLFCGPQPWCNSAGSFCRASSRVRGGGALSQR